MFKRFSFLLLLLLFSFFCFPQTGPAGVGTSTTNAFWVKADAGTSSTNNNSAISFWNDQSGNALHTTQTVTAQQPSFATNVMNGFPAILFDNVNSSGGNDRMVGPDSPLLDNTSFYTFFYVTRPINFGDARVIISKRTNVGVNQSFMLFYYTSNRLNIDLQTNDNRYTSNTTYTTATNYIGCLTYDGTIATSGLRTTLYNGETFDRNAAETATLVLDNASPLLIGSTDMSDDRPFGGYMSEIIIYRETLTPAKRIIVNNYLSAKYNIALSANDKYAGDDPGNGDYDREVAGIGRESSGSNTSFSASISGGLTIAATAGLDNGDYLLAGHAMANNNSTTSDVGGMTGPNNAHWTRIWYFDITNTSTAISANVEFDMSDGGLAGFTPGNVAHYVLLYRVGQTGNWTELASANAVTGDRIIFNSVTLNNDGYYTIGTKNYNPSPLPVELISFSATPNGNKVDINWSTASEKNNEGFTIERSKDGIHFEPLTKIKGAGNSRMIIDYWEVDYAPLSGISYYRLKQTDMDGKISYSDIAVVDQKTVEGEMKIFPNPTDGAFKIDLQSPEQKQILVVLRDIAGKEYLSKIVISENNDGVYLVEPHDPLVPGVYLVIAASNKKLHRQKLIVK